MKHSTRYHLLEIATFLVLFTLSLAGLAQVPTVQDCLGAIPVCQDIYVEENSYYGSGNYPNEIYTPPGSCDSYCPSSCLDGEQNSVWYVFTVQQSGDLSLVITPLIQTDDYDWAVYDISFLRCTDIFSHPLQMQKSCNAAGGSGYQGNTGISSSFGGTANCNNCGSTSKWNANLPVTAGSTYVLIIENWGSPQGGYTLDFSQSTAVIYDNIRPSLDEVHGDEITCGTTEVVVEFSENVTCESVDPSDFVFSGPGGPYQVVDVTGEVCLLGGEMERIFTLYLDKPINEDGDYSVQLTALSFVYDACNNFALGNTIVFTVDLGAPVIDESAMAVNAATCGLSNGSITGLAVTGSTPFAYTWIDGGGNVVGNDLDLLDVPSGNYYFSVEDPNTCAVSGGPYFVDQTGAPGIDESAMVITGATWGANNGSVTGISADGTEPITYVWTDESSNVVGSDLDLLNVYTGNYFLLVTDAYGCDTLAGPYFVPQIGGPLSVISVATPPEICFGESSQLMTNGTGGTGTYTFAWTSSPPGFNSDLESPTVFPTVTTTYFVVINDGFGIAETSVTVTVNPLPVSNAGPDLSIPYGTSVTLSGSASGGSGNYSYSWEPAGMLINPTAQNPATKNLYATTLFKLTVTDESTGCVSEKDTVLVGLVGGPLGLTLEAQSDTICKGETTLLNAYGNGGNEPNYTYYWYYGTELVKQENNTVSSMQVTGLVPGNLTYQVVIWDGYNGDTVEVSVEVMDSPVFQIAGGDVITACPCDSRLLQPSQAYSGYTYYWSNGSTEQSIKIGTTGIGYDERDYALTIKTPYDCQYTDSVHVVFDFAACFGIEEYETFPSVKVFPNPTPGKFTVEFEDGEGFKELVVLNSMGKVIKRVNLESLHHGVNNLVVDLEDYPSGIYFVQAINERFIHHQKVIRK